MAVLEVLNLKKSFGKTKVLKGVSFSLEKGQVLAIIGSSGSGKTTLLRCINFLETPQKGIISVGGEVLFDGDDPSKKKEKEIQKERQAFVHGDPTRNIVGCVANGVPADIANEIYDEILPVSNEDAFVTARLIAKSEGVLVGISSGAALHAATLLANREENKGKQIVCLLPDTGDRYLSTPLFAE